MSESSFIKDAFERAKKLQKNIVLPEGSDPRVLEAAMKIDQADLGEVTVLGDIAEMESFFKDQNYTPKKITLRDPKTDPAREELALVLYEKRKHKGMTEEAALEAVSQVNVFGTLLLEMHAVDGLVSGAAHSTADTVRPALQIIKAAKKGGSVSSLFVMCINDVPYIFSDCGLIENPTAEQLADIAVQSALSAKSFGVPPHVAMLSYSTYGSAKSPQVEKVVKATALAKEKIAADYADEGIVLDGELQADSAIVEAVAAKKCPDSPLSGQARVLIFPNLDAGNIGYKLVQRFAGAEAYGPLLQGLKKPVNDLSRGCSADDIVGVYAITALQTQG